MTGFPSFTRLAAPVLLLLNPLNDNASADELARKQKVKDQKPDIVVVEPNLESDRVVIGGDPIKRTTGSLLALSEPVKTNAEPKVVDIKKDLKPSDYETLDGFYQAVIDRETAKGTLKRLEDFTTKDSSGRKVPNEQAYKTYVERIMKNAKKFEDPNNLESLLNGINGLLGNNSKGFAVLSPTDAAYLTSYPDYEKALNLVNTLVTKAKNGETEQELIKYAQKQIKRLQDGSYVIITHY